MSHHILFCVDHSKSMSIVDAPDSKGARVSRASAVRNHCTVIVKVRTCCSRACVSMNAIQRDMYACLRACVCVFVATTILQSATLKDVRATEGHFSRTDENAELAASSAPPSFNTQN
eukprot:TRINITY_DN2706_c0_g1_i2.p2 TRINITY_DN2706_c0_g1~~TRINITY_DN2706_c0_g1_i2.p2  ORF type:complete len:134 (-),score=10.37 TRINITY_DN2706_c0_g1_i2:414-764(-)